MGPRAKALIGPWIHKYPHFAWPKPRADFHAEAIRWWMAHRHGWEAAPDWILTAHGLVNGTALCVDAFTRRGDPLVDPLAAR